MKKSLLSLAALALLSTATFAQRTAAEVWDLLKDDYSVKTDASLEKVTGVSGLLDDAVKDRWDDQSDHYTHVITDGVIKVTVEKQDAESNWSVLGFNWAQWKGTSGKQLEGPKADRDTLFGYVLDLTNDADDLYLTGEYKLTMDNDPDNDGGMEIRYDMVDLNGHLGNGSSAKKVLPAVADWSLLEVEMQGTQWDFYNQAFWDVTCGRGASAASEIVVNDTTWTMQTTDSISVDMSQLVQILFTFDEDKKAAEGKKYVLEMKDLIIGNKDAAMPVASMITGTVAIADAPKTEIVCAGGVVKAEGEIKVLSPLGVVVASGVDEVEISGLPTAAYIVKAGNASVTVVK